MSPTVCRRKPGRTTAGDAQQQHDDDDFADGDKKIRSANSAMMQQQATMRRIDETAIKSTAVYHVRQTDHAGAAAQNDMHGQ